MALVLPLFLVLVVTLLGFGWSMHCASSVRYALEESARQLPLDPSIDQARLQSMVQSRLQGLGDSNVTVALTQDSPSAGLVMAHATATYHFAVSVPFLSAYAGTYVARTDVPLSAS
jgi:Flp pilus assembly protein TadG